MIKIISKLFAYGSKRHWAFVKDYLPFQVYQSKHKLLYLFLWFSSLSLFFSTLNNNAHAQVGSTCKEFIYLNSGNFNPNTAKIHKFAVGSGGPFTEVIVNNDAWYPGASGIDNTFNYPHGLGVDRNGFLYIGNAVFSPNAIRRFDCVGNLKPASEFIINNPGALLTNVDSYDGFIYSNGGGAKIYKWNPCTGAAMGFVQLDDGSDDWGFSIDNKGKFYVTNASGKIYVFTPTASDFTANTTYNPVINLGGNTTYGGLSPAYAGKGLQGITVDKDGNIYVVEGNRDVSGTPSRLLKFSPTFSFLAAGPIDSNGSNGAGWNQMVGVVYSSTTNKLYTSSLNAAEDCLYSFNTNLTSAGAVVGPDPTGLGGKGLNILKECCPVSGTIERSVCGVKVGDRISLSDLISTDGGVICDGQWAEVGSSTGLTFNNCDLTVTVTGNTACGTFTITNKNTPNKTCADYEITLKVSILPKVTAQVISGNQNVCPTDDPAAFTVTLGATTTPPGPTIAYQWQKSTTSTTTGFSNIANTNNATYDSGPVSQTTYFRVIASIVGCSNGLCSDTSNVLTLTLKTDCCVKPNAGPDQNIACTNNTLPTSFDLVDAAAGQKWKIISPVPAGSSISVTTPTGAVSGTIVAGVYKFRLQTQSDSVNCADTVQVTIQACPCVKPNAGPDQSIACSNNALPTSFDLVDAAAGQKWKIISPVPAGASISVTTPTGAVSGTIVAGVYKFRLQTQSDSVACADTVQVTIQACPCVKPNAGPDQTLTCVNGNPPTSFDLVDAASGQKWKIISPVPAGASITLLTPSGAVSGTIVAGTYKFRLQNQIDSLACADTVQVTVLDCTPGSDPICFSSSRVVTDNKLGAVCTPPVTPEVLYSFFLILKNNTGTHDRFKNSNLKFEEYCDGTAKIYGTVCSIDDPNLCLEVVYNLSGRTTTPPAGSPYAGLCNSNTSGFYYYTGGSGTITGKSGSGFNNLSITIVREGAAFQVGVGANTNENVFGAGGWFKPTIVNDGDGNWTAEVVGSSGIVHGDFNLNLSTTQTPLYNLTATGSVVCEGKSATLTANLDEKCTVTYKWTGPNGFSATGASVTVPNATATGVYTVTAEITSATGNKCSKSDTAIVTVIPKPTVVVVNGFPACRQNGTTYSIKFTKSPAGAVVTAKNVATGATIAVTGDSIANIPLTVAKVRLIVTNGACKDSIEVSAPTCDKPVGSIGDLIWKDVNDNGLQDLPAEKGVSGIKVNLYAASGGTKTGAILQTKTTDNNGLYLFTGLLAGDYIVEIDKTTLPDTCTITSKQNIPSDDSKDSDFNPTSGLSQVVTLNPVFNPSTPTEILATNNLTVDAGLVVPCIKSKVTLTNTPICSADLQTYSFTFNVTGKNGTIKVNKGTLTGSNPYTITGIPSGATVKITDSLSAVCKFDTLIAGPNCNCNPSLPKLLTSSFTACIGDTFPTLKATVVGLATVEWFASETSTTVLFTGLNFKPSGTITGNTFYYAQARSTDPACPAAISTSRVMATINAQDCNKEVDLALKKSINTKIAQIGDVLTYTLKVWNESNNNATGVEVSDSIATTVQFVTGSFVSSRGTATITGNVIKWTIGNITANGDTVTLTYRVKATQEGVHFNTAEICKTNEKDVDSTPCNNKDDEDDIDHQCFTVPFKLCPGEKVEARVPSTLSNVQWFKNGSITPIATGNTVLLSDVGTYTFTATNQTCPANGCCPIIIEEGNNCCPVDLCIPFTIKKRKK